MEIILLQDYPGLGHKNDLIKVRDGYARNYLIPKGIAKVATEQAKKVLAENLKQQAHKEAKLRQIAEENAKKLANMVIKVGAKTSSTGKIFGSVNTIQLADALNKNGFQIDRKQITIYDAENIKEVGTYKAKVKLYRDITADFTFEVYSE
ncbi:MAG: 50S ribosomal protein L9 [Bacteroidales bacterium]|nr:50S ribosomal protein L9 [Bacteroidales bacterium]